MELEKEKDKFRILVVDDAELNRDFLTEILDGQYEVLTAANGKEALDLLEKEGPETVDLMLLDIFMPEVDGFEVLSTMKERGWDQDVPVIIISSATSTDVITRAFDMGAKDFVNRPFNVALVKRRVENTILLTKKEQEMRQVFAEQLRQKENDDRLMLSLLGHLVEFRNGYNVDHVLHMNEVTGLLLEKLREKAPGYELDDETVDLIVKASSLHDIGKMAVDEKILNKPGRLTEEEFEVVKEHSAQGEKILDQLKDQDLPLVQMARQICRWHHERYDGKGYPDALVGDEIPIAAQVVSLADVYDALTSERVYKPAFSHQMAMNMILQGECGTFNPILLECLKELDSQLESVGKAEPGTVPASPKKKQAALSLQGKDHQARKEQFDRAQIGFLYDHTEQMFGRVTNGRLYMNQALEAWSGLESPVDLETISLVPPLKDIDTSGQIDRMVVYKGKAGPVRIHLLAEKVLTGGKDPVPLGWMVLVEPDKKAEFAVLEQTEESMTAAQAASMVAMLSTVFDKVRLVEPDRDMELGCGHDGLYDLCTCHDIWGRGGKCELCVSAMCLREGRRLAKFELKGGEVYYIIAQPLVVDGRACCLEMIDHLTGDMLLLGMPEEDLQGSLLSYQRQLYQDALTTTHNRRFYEERLARMENVEAVAMVDINAFKGVNDTYGHGAGDKVLQHVAWKIKDSIRKNDYVARYGGDEFVIVFPEIPPEVFKRKMEELQEAVARLTFEEWPDLEVSVSIGGIYGPGGTVELMHIADELMYKAKKDESHLRVGAPEGGQKWIFGKSGKK